jgi:hypothetical protein
MFYKWAHMLKLPAHSMLSDTPGMLDRDGTYALSQDTAELVRDPTTYFLPPKACISKK